MYTMYGAPQLRCVTTFHAPLVHFNELHVDVGKRMIVLPCQSLPLFLFLVWIKQSTYFGRIPCRLFLSNRLGATKHLSNSRVVQMAKFDRS